MNQNKSDIILIDVSSLCYLFPHLIKFTSLKTETKENHVSNLNSSVQKFSDNNNNNNICSGAYTLYHSDSNSNSNSNFNHFSDNKENNSKALLLRPQYSHTSLFAPQNESVTQYKIIFDSNVILPMLRFEDGQNNSTSPKFRERESFPPSLLIDMIDHITTNFESSRFWSEYQNILESSESSESSGSSGSSGSSPSILSDIGDDLKLQEWRLHITKGPLFSQANKTFKIELILIPNTWSFETVRYYYYYLVNRGPEYLNSKVGVDLELLQKLSLPSESSNSSSILIPLTSLSLIPSDKQRLPNYIVHLDITELVSVINNGSLNEGMKLPYTYIFPLYCNKTSSKNKLYDIICIYLLNHKGFEKTFNLYLTLKALTSLGSLLSPSSYPTTYSWSLKNLFLSNLQINNNNSHGYIHIYTKIAVSHENKLTFYSYIN